MLSFSPCCWIELSEGEKGRKSCSKIGVRQGRLAFVYVVAYEVDIYG